MDYIYNVAVHGPSFRAHDFELRLWQEATVALIRRLTSHISCGRALARAIAHRNGRAIADRLLHVLVLRPPHRPELYYIQWKPFLT